MSIEGSLADAGAILEMRGITKTFPGVKALSNVNLGVRAGRSTPWWERTARASRRS